MEDKKAEIKEWKISVDPALNEVKESIIISRKTGDDLFEVIEQRLNLLTSIGFQVGGIVSDHCLHNISGEDGCIIHLERFEQVCGEQGNALEDMNDTIDAMYSSIKQNLMDKKYPHTCFECKNPIMYNHAYGQYYHKYNQTFLMNEYERAKNKYKLKKQFKKWWKDKRIQFLCCSCYAKATKNLTIREELSIDHYENP